MEAVNAVEAIQILQTNPFKADLVLSDIRMPGAINGFGLAKWIRENLPSIPVILASGEATKFDAAREMCANIPFFQKPYDPQALVAQIREMLATRRA